MSELSEREKWVMEDIKKRRRVGEEKARVEKEGNRGEEEGG